MGLQGKAVVHDLEQSSVISEIIAADMDADSVNQYLKKRGYQKTRAAGLNASDENELNRFVKDSRADVLISMLPPDLEYAAALAALNAGIPYINSNYAGKVAELDQAAKEKGVTLLPEMGLDPGIDLILGQSAVKELDEITGFYSYGGGLPDPACAGDNALHYKITWTFDGVLKTYKRPALLLKNGKEFAIPGDQLFREENIHEISIPEMGKLEAFPNGDALKYIDIFGLKKEPLKEMGRFALRWPGHSRFWQVMSDMGFLEDTALEGTDLSPRRFLVRHLTPRLQFREKDRDVAILRVCVWGMKDGKKRKVTLDMFDYRDIETDLFAMNRTVGFTASIAAQMILSGKITKPGVLSPARHVPPSEMLAELEKRGIHVKLRTED